MDLAQRLRNIEAGIQNLGLGYSIVYRLKRAHVRAFGRRTPYRLYSRRLRHPILCRPDTTDVDVFSQIFVGREYRCLDNVRSADFIIDCGANVGYSSAYFLSQYPGARLVAVEPDPGNFEMLKRNLEPFGARARAVNSAVWSRSVGLRLSEEQFRDGREWSRTVRPVAEGEAPTMMAVDIGSLWRESGFDRISILKIDIEGAEREVFADNYDSWLSRVDNLVIELHGPECTDVFQRAIASQGFDVSECDELTVCLRAAAR